MKKFFNIIWDKLLIVIATGVVTLTLTLLTPIKDNIVKFFGVTKELVEVNKKIDDLTSHIQNQNIPVDTCLYGQISIIREELGYIRQSQKVTNIKLDIIKETNKEISQRFNDVDRVVLNKPDKPDKEYKIKAERQ
jgi:hypothetical protein